MNFHQLLHQRDALLRPARLANTAYAYRRLGEFAGRITRAQLHGVVRLDSGDPDGERPWPGLTALDGSQAVLEEHFLDEEILELADILRFLGKEADAGFTFRLEDLGGRFLPGLRLELEQAGINPGLASSPREDSNQRLG